MKKYNPTKNELRAALIDLCKAVEMVSSETFIIQPFLSVYKKHAKTLSCLQDVMEWYK